MPHAILGGSTASRCIYLQPAQVKQLFKKLGIERVDGWVFFENVLLPVLSGGSHQSTCMGPGRVAAIPSRAVRRGPRCGQAGSSHSELSSQYSGGQ